MRGFPETVAFMKHTPARDPEAIEFARGQRATANEFDGADHFTEAGQERGFPVLTCSANRSGFAKALRSG